MRRILKNNLFVIVVFTFVGHGNSQDFQGYIEYEVNVKKTDSTFKDDEFLKGLGNKSIFYYTDGSYFQSDENSIFEFGYLDSRLKQFGLKYKNNDTLYLFDATKESKIRLIKTEKSSSTKVILGHKCSEINFYVQNIVDGYNLVYNLYYTDELKIHGEKFEGIKFEFYDKFYGELNSIPLELNMQYPIFNLQYTAIKIVQNDTVSVLELIENSRMGLIVKKIN